MTVTPKKRPLLPIRDLGGSFQINNPDDGTPIREMFSLGISLLMITDKCTYKMQLADQIDPERKNPKLPPNFQQKLFDHGIKSELICHTLLHAKTMFRKEFQTIDTDKARHLSFDAVSDLIAMDEAAQAFSASEQSAIEKVQSLERKDLSLTIPTVGNVRADCKTFFQKAHHFTLSLLEIVRLFYPEMKKKDWDDLLELVKSKYGESDYFYKVLEIEVPRLKLIYATRNCLDHQNVKGVITRDFELQADGTIMPPTIEVNRDGNVLDRSSISLLMEFLTTTLLDAFEMITLHMCSKNIQPFAGLPMTIALLSEEYQKAWYVRFAYGSYYQGQFVPCG